MYGMAIPRRGHGALVAEPHHAHHSSHLKQDRLRTRQLNRKADNLPDRFSPFKGAGVTSTRRPTLLTVIQAFDYGGINDSRGPHDTIKFLERGDKGS